MELVPGLPTSLGSLPHIDAREAAAFVLRLHPDLPAAPQLPVRSPREGMVAQASAGIAGVTVADDGSLVLDNDRLDPAAPVDTTPGEESVGLLAFLDAVADRTAAVKLQLTGPVTLGLAFVHAGCPADVAVPLAAAAVAQRSRALLDLVSERAPGAAPVLFLDEPALSASRHPGAPVSPGEATDLLSGVLSSIAPRAVTGVHCCGSSAWEVGLKSGPTILSLPAVDGVVDEAPAIAAFLEGGGWVAWGAVPTTGPVGDDADLLWRRLVALWCALIAAGCDPVLLRRQSLVTPVCGLAGHGPSQAERVLTLTVDLARRVQDQALAARLSVGA